MYCQGMLFRISSVSIVSSRVVGLRKVFSTIFAGYDFGGVLSSYAMKSDFLTPHSGHCQSSGISPNSVPGSIPLSSSPTIGS